MDPHGVSPLPFRVAPAGDGSDDTVALVTVEPGSEGDGIQGPEPHPEDGSIGPYWVFSRVETLVLIADLSAALRRADLEMGA
jgi:hypothetical protein